MVRALACHARGRGFEPLPGRHYLSLSCAGVAQLAEQLICNQQVAGSSPFAGSTFLLGKLMGRFPSGQREQTVNLPSQTSVVRIHPCPPKSFSPPRRHHLREWRNWQTRMIQVHVFSRTCRFKSCFPHQQQIIRTTYSSSEKGSDYLFSSCFFLNEESARRFRQALGLSKKPRRYRRAAAL